MNLHEGSGELIDDAVPGSVSAAEAFEGLPITGAPGLSAVRLTQIVGAASRAAIDLVLGEDPPRRPLSVVWDDGALEVTLPVGRLDHLTAAGSLLETVDGNLGPAREGRSFLMRVPVAATRGMYLMLQQATISLAVPWHSVIRIRMIEASRLEALARREGCPVLPPFVSVPTSKVERPAVLVGLGLRRGFLQADRLVWRMPALPTGDTVPAPGASLGPSVRTADGGVFWVVDPARLLKEVEPAPLPSSPIVPRRSPSRVQDQESSPRPQPAARPRRVEPALIELRPEDVEPLSNPTEAPPKPTRSGRRALVVEDSIVGRIFLQRLLAAQGFSVESASSASQLRHAIGLGTWDVLFVDVALPDSPRGEHLNSLAGSNAVALVRDAHDERLATAAGVRLSLRKPFERGELLRVIEALGLQGETA